jgi:hypothetical protein
MLPQTPQTASVAEDDGKGKKGKKRDMTCFGIKKWILTWLWLALFFPGIAWLFGFSKYQTRVKYVRAIFTLFLIILFLLAAVGFSLHLTEVVDFSSIWNQVKSLYDGLTS